MTDTKIESNIRRFGLKLSYAENKGRKNEVLFSPITLKFF